MVVENIFADVRLAIVEYLPKIVGALIVLIIGWIAGRIIGKGVSKFFEKAGIDEVFRKTIICRAIEKRLRQKTHQIKVQDPRR